MVEQSVEKNIFVSIVDASFIDVYMTYLIQTSLCIYFYIYICIRVNIYAKSGRFPPIGIYGLK